MKIVLAVALALFARDLDAEEWPNAPLPEQVVTASHLQPQPALLPPPEFSVEPSPSPGASRLSAALFGEIGSEGSLLTQRITTGITSPDIVFGREAAGRVTTDAGSLLGASPAALGVGVQRRTPIVTDPRVRGSRVGQLAGSGSYWVPARIDLDTVLSKIDSRILDRIEVIKGPYSVRHGPGLDFLDVQLAHSPRFADGPHLHGSSGFDFKTNGQQWYGQQRFWGGSEDWGFRAGYGHRTGNDYVTGDGRDVPASYNSRDLDLALGRDLSAGSFVEFNLLRLDQTNVEYPGQAFDMDYLVTDGYDLEYVAVDRPRCDRLEFDVWYNRTRFAGDAQRPGKRRQFPMFDVMHYVGFTDVDSMSTGFRLASTWGQDDDPQFTAGVDLRCIRQELNEIGSGRIGVNIFRDANSPIPRSQWINPGLFVEETLPLDELLRLRVGARTDWTSANVIDDPAKLAHLGNQTPQSSLDAILGSDAYRQHFQTWAVYVGVERELNEAWTLLATAGHGQRPPSLTELYAAQPFMFVLENGLNTVTGDPRLHPERAWQIDVGLQCDYEQFRAGVTGFHAWIHDYITFENLGVVRGPTGYIEQVNLKYVNTDLATLAGGELFGEYDLAPWWTPFATLRYVDGRDRTRNGDFATRAVRPGVPSERVPGLPRGDFSGIPGAPAEPLPSILPLESRLGLRLHPPLRPWPWCVEASVRVANHQDRVATSLVELPTPGFTIVDLRAYWRPRQHVLLVAGVENLGDRNYREHLDFHAPSGMAVYQPGVNFYFGSELSY